MQDRSPKSVGQVLAMLKDQDDNLAGLNVCASQRAGIRARTAQELVKSEREVVRVWKLQGERDPVGSPRVKRLEAFREGSLIFHKFLRAS